MAQTERRGGAGPVRGLLGGKASPAALLDLNFSPVPTTRLWRCFHTLLIATQRPEHVIVAGGSVVGENDCQQVGGSDAARGEVEAAAHALPVTAPDARRTAVSTVADDRAVNGW